MAGKYDDLARFILENVGGRENINSVAHCVTRLRLKLKDEGKADTEAIKASDGVITVISANGQYQVVIGNAIEDVYDAFLAVSGMTGAGEVDVAEGDGADNADQSLAARAIDLVSGILAPTLPLLAASGILRGLLALATFLHWMEPTDGAYLVWNGIGNGFFYFLPILLGYTSAKKFNCNEFLGMAIGISLVYPDLVNITKGEVMGSLFAGTAFQMNYYTTFFGIPIVMPATGYTSSVIPVILAVWVASKVEKWVRPRTPEAVKMFIVPFSVIVTVAPLTYLVIGPISTMITNLMSWVFSSLYAIPVVGGPLAGLVIGGLWQVLVMFGFHWAVVSLGIVNLSTLGYDSLMPLSFFASWAQTFVVLAIYFRTKDEKLKKLALPTFISGLFGVTEPAIYGITLPKKKPFVVSCVVSAAVAAVVGMLHPIKFGSGGLGIFGLAMYIDPAGEQGINNLVIMAIGAAVACVLGFVAEFILYREDEPAKKAA